METSNRLFVPADTHNKFSPIIETIEKDTDEIWHLGDVCAERILDELRASKIWDKL